MRQDMGKCIIERPRSNSRAPSAKARDYGRFIHDDDGIDYDGPVHRYEMTKVLVSEFKRQLGKKQLKALGLKNY